MQPRSTSFASLLRRTVDAPTSANQAHHVSDTESPPRKPRIAYIHGDGVLYCAGGRALITASPKATVVTIMHPRHRRARAVLPSVMCGGPFWRCERAVVAISSDRGLDDRSTLLGFDGGRHLPPPEWLSRYFGPQSNPASARSGQAYIRGSQPEPRCWRGVSSLRAHVGRLRMCSGAQRRSAVRASRNRSEHATYGAVNKGPPDPGS